MILTKEQDLTKAEIAYSSWARNCDNHTFLSPIPYKALVKERFEVKFDNNINILKPEGFIQEGRSQLTKKVLFGLRDVYLHNPNYDWYVKADDDTFMFIDNLRSFLNDKNSSELITYGYNFILNDKRYHSGGAGYVISKSAVKKLSLKLHELLNQNSNFCGDTGVEDIDVSQCLQKLDVKIGKSVDENGRERFHPLSYDSYHRSSSLPIWMYDLSENPIKMVMISTKLSEIFKIIHFLFNQKKSDCCSEMPISFHYEGQVEMLALNKLSNTKFNNYTYQIFDSLRDVLKQDKIIK